MKKLIKLFLIIMVDVFIVACIIFAFNSLKKENTKISKTLPEYKNIDYYVDYVGTLYDGKIEEAYPFQNGFAPIYKDAKWGYINKEGKLIVDFLYDSASLFTEEGLACVKKGDKWGFIDTNGNVVIDFRFDKEAHFIDGIASVLESNKVKLIYSKGETILQTQYDDTRTFTEGLVGVKKDDKW